MFAVRINVCGLLGVATGELLCAIEVCGSFEAAVREAVLKREEREADVARATARIIMWGRICQATLMYLVELVRLKLPRRDDVTACH